VPVSPSTAKSVPTSARPKPVHSAPIDPDPSTSAPTEPPPAVPEPPPAVPEPPAADGSACFATAIHGGFDLGDNESHNAGGPNFTSSACNDIHVKLTSARYRTYARSCLEVADGSSITSCSSWILLSYPDTWDTLSVDVPAGSRWQIQMYALSAETVAFSYTA
jgi:hypothetical protein